VRVWEVASGKELSPRRPPQAPVSCLAYAPDGRLLATGGKEPTIYLWETSLPGRPRALRGRFSSDGLAFVAGGLAALGGEASWWALRTGVRRSRLERRLERRPLALSADGRVAAYEVEGRAVQLVEVATGKDGKKFGRDVNCVAFSADGRLLATGSDG